MTDINQPTPEAADVKPTPESLEAARSLVARLGEVEKDGCLQGLMVISSEQLEELVLVIAEYLTRNDRELTRWINQEIQEKTECLQRHYVVEAERRMRAQSEVDDLKQELDALKVVIGRGVNQFHGTTWTHDIPKSPAGLEQCIERLRRTDGTHADAAVIVWEQCQMLVVEIDWLRAKGG